MSLIEKFEDVDVDIRDATVSYESVVLGMDLRDTRGNVVWYKGTRCDSVILDFSTFTCTICVNSETEIEYTFPLVPGGVHIGTRVPVFIGDVSQWYTPPTPKSRIQICDGCHKEMTAMRTVWKNGKQKEKINICNDCTMVCSLCHMVAYKHSFSSIGECPNCDEDKGKRQKHAISNEIHYEMILDERQLNKCRVCKRMRSVKDFYEKSAAKKIQKVYRESKKRRVE